MCGDRLNRNLRTVAVVAEKNSRRIRVSNRWLFDRVRCYR